MTDHPVFPIAPMSKMGLTFAQSIVDAYDGVVAAIDDTSSIDTIFGKPRWSSTQFLERIENHPGALAIDFSVSHGSRAWASRLCEKAAVERLDCELAWSRLRLPAYTAVKPLATYSPWLKDAEFLSLVREISGSTLVDHLRLWELWRLVDETRHIPGCILEVGVWRGGTGTLMARKLQQQGGVIYLCDTFSGVVKAGSLDSYYTGGEHADTSKERVAALLEKLAPDVTAHILEGVFPDITGMQVEHETFRLVHIDVDVYQSARDILDFIWPRMSPGGIVVYDDFGFDVCSGITAHVEEQQGKADALSIHNLNGHALLIKR